MQLWDRYLLDLLIKKSAWESRNLWYLHVNRSVSVPCIWWKYAMMKYQKNNLFIFIFLFFFQNKVHGNKLLPLLFLFLGSYIEWNMIQMLVYKRKSFNAAFYEVMIHNIWYKSKVHRNTTRMGLENPCDDSLVILEVVSIERLQVLAILGQV